MPVEEGEERKLEHAKMRIFPKSIRVAFFFFFPLAKQSQVLAEGNVRNLGIQGEIRPKVYSGKKRKE